MSCLALSDALRVMKKASGSLRFHPGILPGVLHISVNKSLELFSTPAPDAPHPERRMAREASPLGHPVKIIKISLESKLSILDFYDFHRVLNSYMEF